MRQLLDPLVPGYDRGSLYFQAEGSFTVFFSVSISSMPFVFKSLLTKTNYSWVTKASCNKGRLILARNMYTHGNKATTPSFRFPSKNLTRSLQNNIHLRLSPCQCKTWPLNPSSTSLQGSEVADFKRQTGEYHSQCVAHINSCNTRQSQNAPSLPVNNK